MKKSLILILLLTPLWAQGAPKLKELLVEVNSNKAQRIADYNSVFLQKTLYFASRHRIVKADTKLLLKGDEFTVTPFDDVEPLHVITEPLQSQQRHGDFFHFNANVVLESDAPIAPLVADYSFLIGAHAYDLNESGEALISISNRFKYSPYWNFDEFDRPVLETPPDGQRAFAGSPPESPEDIEQHKKLKKLKKHKFYSVRTTISTLDGKTYVVKPLKYTPKYSVVYEVDPAVSSFVQIDADPDGVDRRSDDQKMNEKRYQNFRKNLPKEEWKIVKGDIE